MKNFQTQYGPWAVVTGASSGIGEEFARQLAARGINLILAARRKNLLDELARELERDFWIKVKTVQVDLTGPYAVDILNEATQDIEVGLLVNNAGAENHGAFLGADVEQEAKIIQLNSVAPMQLAYTFGQKMVNQGRGGIIFIASVAGYSAVPYLANYAATKAYILSLGEALNLELKKHGVDVTVLSPGLTTTEMTEKMVQTGLDFSKLPMDNMDVAPVVRAALSALGNQPSVIPGESNNFFVFLGKRILSRIGMASLWKSLMEKAMSTPVHRPKAEEVTVVEKKQEYLEPVSVR